MLNMVMRPMLTGLVVLMTVAGYVISAPAQTAATADAAAPASDGMLDTCRYGDDRHAQTAWTCPPGGSPVRMTAIDGRAALHLPCHVADRRAQQWRRAVAVDLTKAAGVQMDVYCPETEPVRTFDLQVSDGDTWGTCAIGANRLGGGWNLVRLCKSEVLTDGGEALDWSRIRTIGIRVGADRPASARLALANLRVLAADTEMGLDRDGRADFAETVGGALHTGVILNQRYELTTRLGRTSFEAGRVVGMTLAGAMGRILLTDGQIYTGLIDTNAALEMVDPAGCETTLPLSTLRRWTYRLSASRGESALPARPFLVIGSDRITYGRIDPALTLSTMHGTIALPMDRVARLESLGDGDRYRASFFNGSVLTGALGPRAVQIEVPDADPAVFEPAGVRLFARPGVVAPPAATCVKLHGGQSLHGRIVADALTVKTATGLKSIGAADILRIEFDPVDTGRVRVHGWGESIVAGRLLDKTVRFQLAGCDTILSLQSDRIISLAGAHARPRPAR